MMVRDYKLRSIKNMTLSDLMKRNPFVTYTYAYPHKTSYREFSIPYSLGELWEQENTSHLFLYIHIPFCQQRCGYCNLFSKIGKQPELVDKYIDAMEKQAKTISLMFQSLKKPFHFDYIAIGGGSPSLLSTNQMIRVLDIAEEILHTPITTSDLSIEIHPNCSEDLLELLLERHAYRISVGVQSFLDKDLKRLFRYTPSEEIHESLDTISSMGFPNLNIDLIYGIEDQKTDDFLKSIDYAINYEPDEFYLYPLYVRPKTALGESQKNPNSEQLKLYFDGRHRLLDSGYHQDSMRRFVKKRNKCTNTSVEREEYSCNMDGMMGLGCGSRSYTKEVHYSEPYAVSQSEVHQIIQDYIKKTPAEFLHIPYGITLNEEDKQRRFILKSLFKVKGLDTDSFRREFNIEPQKGYPELVELLDIGLAHKNGSFIVLTERGLALSDILGPWLYSQKVIDLMEGFDIE